MDNEKITETEKEFLENYVQKYYPTVSITVDTVLFTYRFGGFAGMFDDVLVVRRKNHPFKDYWALPGGFSDPGETLEESAVRELFEETSVKIFVENIVQVKTYSDPDRDPRGRIISTAFATYMDRSLIKPFANDDAVEYCFMSVKKIINNEIKLAFDHNKIVKDAYYTMFKNM